MDFIYSLYGFFLRPYEFSWPIHLPPGFKTAESNICWVCDTNSFDHA